MKIVRRIWGFIVVVLWKAFCCTMLCGIAIPLIYLHQIWQILKKGFTSNNLKVDTLWAKVYKDDFCRLLDKIEEISEII